MNGPHSVVALYSVCENEIEDMVDTRIVRLFISTHIKKDSQIKKSKNLNAISTLSHAWWLFAALFKFYGFSDRRIWSLKHW